MTTPTLDAYTNRLWTWLATAEALEAMTDTEVADLLHDWVYVALPTMTPASDIVAEAIARLRGERSTP